MTDSNENGSTSRIPRRRVLTGVGVGLATGIAGCGGGQPESPTTQHGESTGTNTTATQTRSEIPGGGTPVVGMASPPPTLHPLGNTSAYGHEIIENIYTPGGLLHPKTQEYTPWAFKDWTLTPENIGSDDSTLTGTLRDDLTFSDGEKLTAEDVEFTIEYVRENEVSGSHLAVSMFESLEEVTVDSPTGTTVNYFFAEEDSSWFLNVLSALILPKHIWKDVADPMEYTPRETETGHVGAGPLELTDYSWEEWFKLQFRPREEIPFPRADYVDWIHPEAPFVDGVRFEIFGSQTALQQAVLNGNVSVPYGSFQVKRAAEATQKDFLNVMESPADGWHHHSFNTRRVPLDDPAFRQLLVMLDDKKWVVDELYRGIGAVKGTYAELPSKPQWRPPAPTEIDKFEGIPVSDLQFPGERGTFQLGKEAVTEARTFLQDHPRAKHNYSVGEAVTDVSAAADGKEIYVDGEPLSEAHTNNERTPGQGPLEMSYNPPQAGSETARLAQRWIGALKTVGIPVQGLVQSFNSQRPKIYIQEDFDMYEMGWTRAHTYDQFSMLYSGDAADVESSSDAYMFNSMGYTGADELIAEQASLMDPAERKPVVKKLLARMWADAPTDITHYTKTLQPVNRAFTGWIKTIGGVTEPGTWMNLRKTNGNA